MTTFRQLTELKEALAEMNELKIYDAAQALVERLEKAELGNYTFDLCLPARAPSNILATYRKELWGVRGTLYFIPDEVMNE